MNVKKKWTIPVLFLSLFSPVFNGYGQKPDKPGGKPETPDTYKVPEAGSASITTCSGTVYDNGGTGNYADNNNGVLTILPGTKNKSVQLDFTAFDMEPYYDYLEVYNGNSTSAPLLGVYFNNPGKVSATNESGALTLRFFSDGSVNRSGFSASLSCVSKVVSTNSKPDLLAEGFNTIQQDIIAGRNFTVEFKIKNSGDAVASQSNTGFYLSRDTKLSADDKLLGAVAASSIAAGASSVVNADLNIPEGTSSGDYFIIASADYDNKINERRENNNISSAAIKIVPAYSDLYVSSVSIQETEVVQEGYLTVSANFGNKGNTTPKYAEGVVYLSSDAVLDASDFQFGTLPYVYLQAGKDTSYSISGLIPEAFPAGDYYALAMIDYNNQIAEPNEFNNTGITKTTVRIIPGYADLVPAIFTKSTSVYPGNYIYLQTSIYNAGNKNSKESYAGYYLSADEVIDTTDFFLVNEFTKYISPGGNTYNEQLVYIPSGLKHGKYNLIYKADINNEVAESDESNNSTSVIIDVLAYLPELSIGNVQIPSSSISANSTFPVYYYNYNSGYDVAYNFKSSVFLSSDQLLDGSDILVGLDSTSSLYYFSSEYKNPQITIPAGISEGNYYLLFVVDSENNVDEMNENDNLYAANINIVKAGYYNLVPASGSATVTTCAGKVMDHAGTGYYSNYVDGTLTIYPEVSGNKIKLDFTTFELETCCDYLAVYDGTSTDSRLIDYFRYNPGTVYSTNETGALTLRFHSDGSVVYQGFEAEISCVDSVPYPDLTINSVSLSDTNVTREEYFTAGFYIKNNGNATSAYNYAGLYLSPDAELDTTDVFLNSATVYPVQSGDSVYVSISAYVPDSKTTGKYFIIAKSDFTRQVNESDENNNSAAAGISISTLPYDVSLSNVYTNTSDVGLGGTFWVSYYLQNNSGYYMPSVKTGVYLSADSLLDSGDLFVNYSEINQIGGNNGIWNQTGINVPDSVQAGTYYVFLAADYDGQYPETDEANNFQNLRIEIAEPRVDLSFNNLTIYDSVTYKGAQAYGYINIVNNGNISSSTGALNFYLSQDNVLDTTDVVIGSFNSNVSHNNPEGFGVYLNIPTTADTGIYYVIGKLDAYNEITETDETNNQVTDQIHIFPATIDLSVSDFVVQSSVLPGNYVPVRYSVTNNGSVPSSGFYNYFYLSQDTILDGNDTYLNYDYQWGVNGKQTVTRESYFYFPSDYPYGDYHIIIAADAYNWVGEDDETNNITSAPVSLEASKIDFAVTGVNLNDSILSPGHRLLYFTVKNKGNDVGNLHSGFYLSEDTIPDSSDRLLKEDFTDHIPGGYTNTYYVSFYMPQDVAEGRYYIFAKADYPQYYSEENESDNIAYVAVNVSNATYDLTIKGVSEVFAGAGQMATLTYVASNLGNAQEFYAYSRIYLSDDEILDTNDYALTDNTLFIFTDSSFVYTGFYIPSDLQPGHYKLLIVADPDNNLIETNEFNNITAADLTVISSDSSFARTGEAVASTFAKVYPNPTEGQFTLNLNNANIESSAPANITVYNAAGHVIESRTESVSASGFLSSFDLSGFAKGIYAVKVELNGKVETHKVVVE